MPAFIKPANNYFVALYPHGSSAGGRINLYCNDSYRLYLIFKENPTDTNSYDAAQKTGVAYVDVMQFPFYLDIVRNEKPVNVTFNPDTTPPNFVVHANEPVGEGEM